MNTNKQVEKVCKTCHKKFLYKTSQLKHFPGGGQFCSRDCSHHIQYTCVGCGKKNSDGYAPNQKYCTDSHLCKYKAMQKIDPIEKKAHTMSSFITFGGKGKREYFANMLREHLNKPCRYCGSMLTLENISLDHIEPFNSTAARKNTVIKKQMDRKENLQMICRPCNQMKGTLSHDKYIKLLDFLATDIQISQYVVKKLRQSTVMYAHSRWTR